jgi:hypothetical protein
MSLSRRSAMIVSTMGFAAMFAGGFTWRAYSRGVLGLGVEDAYQPWNEWTRAPFDGPIAIARAGVLASNAYNSQPWLFHVQSDRIALYADRTRSIGTLDPYRREMHLSLGCALANMEIAALAQGFEPTTAYVKGRLDGHIAMTTASLGGNDPAGSAIAEMEPCHVATLYLTQGEARHDVLFNAIAERHTNRGPFMVDHFVPMPVQAALMDETPSVGPAVGLFLFGPGEQQARLADLIGASAEALAADPQMREDGLRWFRSERQAVLDKRDGIAYDMIEDETSVDGLLGRIFGSTESVATNAAWPLSYDQLHVTSAPLLGVVAVRDLYDMESTLAAGRLWQRLHLSLTVHGLAAQPLNQPIKLGDRDLALGRNPAVQQQLAKILDAEGWQPTLLFRAGYAVDPAIASPRRSLEDVVMA